MDTSKAVTHIGLCAGYGGIELGLKRAIPSLRTIALCEIEAFAISNLVAKMEAGLMDPAPIWPDLKTFPWAAFCDRVDILTGGYPCQPFSAAGQRKGKQDPRHLWPWIADGIRLLRPRICFFENVEGHISLGLSDVIEDLAGMGYRTTWGIFSASEVGAPHQRKRVFIMANSQRQRVEELSRWIADESKEYTAGNHGSNAWPSRPGEQQYGWEPPRVVADTKLATGPTEIDQRQKPINQDGSDLRDEYSTSSSAMADSHRIDRSAPAEGREHDRQAGPAGEELGDTEGRDGLGSAQREAGHAAQPDEGAGCRQIKCPLGGNFNEPPSGMDYAELCVSCDNRTDELRLLGNGVVPATAERAFRTLIRELL
jgi:DNA (cytosine-5)-methyltransferase 1